MAVTHKPIFAASDNDRNGRRRPYLIANRNTAPDAKPNQAALERSAGNKMIVKTRQAIGTEEKRKFINLKKRVGGVVLPGREISIKLDLWKYIPKAKTPVMAKKPAYGLGLKKLPVIGKRASCDEKM